MTLRPALCMMAALLRLLPLPPFLSEFWPTELPPCDESTLFESCLWAAFLQRSRCRSPMRGSDKSAVFPMKLLVETGSRLDSDYKLFTGWVPNGGQTKVAAAYVRTSLLFRSGLRILTLERAIGKFVRLRHCCS